jgi:hypothetical protein
MRSPRIARRGRCPAAVGLALALLAGWTQAPEERRVTIELGVRFGDGGPAEPCDDPGVDPWIGELRDRVLSYDGLALWAVEAYGAPTSCDGAVTDEFDGAQFGAVTLGFAEGVALTVETMPPEVSIVSLRAPGGFADESAVLQSLRAYTAARGLAIDWDAPPETSVDGDESTATYWDPEAGLNGSASVVTVDAVLVEVRVSMAL